MDKSEAIETLAVLNRFAGKNNIIVSVKRPKTLVHITLVIDGKKYKGKGRNKTEAKADAAIKFLDKGIKIHTHNI